MRIFPIFFPVWLRSFTTLTKTTVGFPTESTLLHNRVCQELVQRLESQVGGIGAFQDACNYYAGYVVEGVYWCDRVFVYEVYEWNAPQGKTLD